jgi:hypothetical protein
MIRLGVVCMAATLAFAPQAAAVGKLKAKFKVVSASGSESLSFHEDGVTSTDERCVGTTASKVSWRTTRPKTVYLFVRRAGGKVRLTLSADRVGEAYEAVFLRGKATVSRSVSYQQTAGCQEQPVNCPKLTASAQPFITGTDERRGSVNAGIDIIRWPKGIDDSCDVSAPVAAGIALPFGNAAGRALLPEITANAWAVPRGRLLDPHRKTIKDSVTVKQPLSATADGADQATVSGTYTDHLKISLKRLKLKR